MENRNEFFIELEETLDYFFPKNMCKERGAALMLFAQAILLHDKYKNK